MDMCNVQTSQDGLEDAWKCYFFISTAHILIHSFIHYDSFTRPVANFSMHKLVDDFGELHCLASNEKDAQFKV